MHSMFFLFLLVSNFFIAPLFGASSGKPPRITPVSPVLYGLSGRTSAATLGEGAPLSDKSGSSRSSSSLSCDALPPLLPLSDLPFGPGRRSSLKQDTSHEYPFKIHTETGIRYCFAGEYVRWQKGELQIRSFRLSEIENKEHRSLFQGLSREEQLFFLWVVASQLKEVK